MPPPDLVNITADSAVIDNCKIISPAHITVENNLITKISSTPHEKKGMQLVLKEQILLPGFTNAHCHLELTDIGSLPQNTFFKWVRSLLEKKTIFDPREFSASIKNGVTQLMRSGVTTIIDHISPTTPSNCYKDLPANIIAFGELAGLTDKIFAENLKQLETEKNKSPVPYRISPHSVYASLPGLLSGFITRQQPPFSIHLDESKDEENYFKNNCGDLFDRIIEVVGHKPHDEKSGFAFLQKHPKKTGGLVVHGNNLTAQDLDRLVEMKSLCLVHCPGSFAFFGHDRFPFHEIRKRRIPMALGTDSLASNSSLSMLDEINLFSENYPDIGFFDLLPMLTTNALQALGIKDRGTLAEGQSADMIGLKIKREFDPNQLLKNHPEISFWMCNGKTIAALPCQTGVQRTHRHHH